MSGAESSKCLECGKKYKRFAELRRHVKNCHPDKLDVISPLRVLKGNILYKCTDCHRQFSHKQNLNYHLKKVHNSVSAEDQKSTQKCPLCNFNATFKKDFIKHYETFHGIPIQCETIQFLNDDDFISWKKEVENETKASFVKEKGKTAGRVNYICHRSGFFRSKSMGKRPLKIQGSIKIDGYCPAMIKQVAQSDGNYLVLFIKTHVGHQPSERHAVDRELAAKNPSEAVLDEVSDGVSDSDSLEIKHEAENVMEIVYVESNTFFEEIDNQSTSRGKTLTERKEEMLQHLCVLVNGIKTEEQWKALEKMVNPIEPTLAAIRQQSSSNFRLKDTKPSHSKILRQSRVLSTKKTPAKKKVQLTVIDSENESQ